MNHFNTSAGEIGRSARELSGNITSFNKDQHSYDLYCLTSVGEIRAIRTEWLALERTSSEAFTYFQSYDWCHQWCINLFDKETPDPDTRLRVYVLRCDGVVAMIWPMMETKTRLNTKILTFLTHPLGQYANILVNTDRVSEKVGRKVWKQIKRHTKVDAITVNLYPENSFLESVLSGVGFAERSLTEASILDLTHFNTWEIHHASLSRNQRKQRNRRRAKLEKHGEVTLEVSLGGSRNYAERVHQALVMKQVWLQKTGRKPGILGERNTALFLESLGNTKAITSDCPQGALTLSLCIDGSPIAIEIGMAKDGHYYSYLGAFDWAWRDYSPGKVQIEAAQNWAKNVGLQKFDFLGDQSDYKEHWTNVTHRLNSKSMPLTAHGLLYCAFWKSRLRPKLKYAYSKMDPDKRKMLSSILTFASRIIKGRSFDSNIQTAGVAKTR